MTPVIHYMFAFLVIYAAGYHVRHRVLTSAALAIGVNMIFEADHLFPIYATEHLKLFHNITFAVFLPVALFLVSALAENRYSDLTGVRDSRYQRMFLMVLLVGTSHIMLDLLDGSEEYILYPFVRTPFVLNSSISISYSPFINLDAWFIFLLAYGLLVLIVRSFEERIYLSMEGAMGDSGAETGGRWSYIVGNLFYTHLSRFLSLSRLTRAENRL